MPPICKKCGRFTDYPPKSFDAVVNGLCDRCQSESVGVETDTGDTP